MIETWFFINYTLLPFLFALALLFFLVNVVRYFIYGSGEAEGRAQARRLALYGIAAFVILVSIWGIVHIFTSALGIGGDRAVCPDYFGDACYGGGDDSLFFFDFFFGGFGGEEDPFLRDPNYNADWEMERDPYAPRNDGRYSI